MRRIPLGALALLGACTVGPDYKSPPAPVVTGYTPRPLPVHTSAADDRHGAAQHFVSDMDIPGQWWTLFHSETLNRLIAQSLAANPDLDRGTGGAAPGAGKRLCPAWLVLSPVVRWVFRQPQPDADGRPVAGVRLRQPVLQPDHAAVERLVRAGCVRRQSSRGRIIGRAGGESALPGGGDISDIDLERCRGGDTGSVIARRRSMRRRRRSGSRTTCWISCAGNWRWVRWRVSMWRRRRPRWRRRNRCCHRCRSSWTSSAICWRRWPGIRPANSRAKRSSCRA